MKKYSLILFLLLWMFNYKNFADTPAFTLESPAFKLNSMIPNQYTCNGADESPPLIWHNAPAKTQSFVLIVEDPDAPNGTWTHWVLFNIPPTITKLEAATPIPPGAQHGKNSWEGLGYRGPCPSLGAHRYVFKIYALDTVLGLDEGAIKDVVNEAMTSHVIGTAELVGLYQKV